MRNLKRVLSLSLASIMLLGMMVIGSSAAQDYTDVDYVNDNVEAIEVLQAINVMSGDLDNDGNLAGTFRPGDEVKRSEMARIMAFLMDLDYDYYIGVNPFTDMVGHWAEKYAAACAANGIIYGRGDGIYDPDKTVTAVEAASMLMRALGYFQNPAVDQPDGFEISTIRQAGRINLFNRVDAKTNEPMTRNDVAQLVLNALQSGMVEPSTNSKIDVTVGDAQVSIGSSNYVYVVSRDKVVGDAINTDKADAGNGADGLEGPILDLGEKLYNGKLKRYGDTRAPIWEASDVFCRPSRTWEYDGKEIGTYMKTENIRETYTKAVTNRTLYDLLGRNALETYTVNHYVDGVLSDIDAAAMILTRTASNFGDSDLGKPDNGVLTQVFEDTERGIIDIVSIHTFLAKAAVDYNATTESVILTVYSGLDNNDNTLTQTKTVSLADVPEIEGLVQDDFIRINVSGKNAATTDISTLSGYDVAVVEDVEILTDSTLSKFSKDSNMDTESNVNEAFFTSVVTDGTEYKSSAFAYYSGDVLDLYDNSLLVNHTYNIYLDAYDYALGIDLYSGDDNYVFITGFDPSTSNIALGSATAAAIFTDGTMGTIKVNVRDTNKNIDKVAGKDGSEYFEPWAGNGDMSSPLFTLNRWYTYTVSDSGDYTLNPALRMFTTEVKKDTDEALIRCDNVRIDEHPADVEENGAARENDDIRAYGNDDSIYIVVDTDEKADLSSNYIISDVAGVYTGVQNVEIEVAGKDDYYDSATTDSIVQGQPGYQLNKYIVNEGDDTELYDSIYTLYDKNKYIIAAVIVGEAKGSDANYAYILTAAKSEELLADGSHEWVFDAVVDGTIQTLKTTSKFSVIGDLEPGHVQELRYNGEYVTGVKTPLDLDDYWTTNKAFGNSKINKEVIVDIGHEPGAKDNSDCRDDFTLDSAAKQGVDSSNPGDNWYWGSTGGGLTTVSGTHLTADNATSLKIEGRTLYLAGDGRSNLGSSGYDRGLTFVENAPAVILHKVDGSAKKIDNINVAQAIAQLGDPNDEPSDGKQFEGRIVAVLNNQGVAKWIVFISDTGVNTAAGNGGGGNNARTITVNWNETTTVVQDYLKSGYNVIVDGSWQPANAYNKDGRTPLEIPANRTLTVNGNFEACGIDGAADVAISGKGKLVVTGTFQTSSSVSNPAEYEIVADDIQVYTNTAVVFNGNITTKGLNKRGDVNLASNNTMKVTFNGTTIIAGWLTSQNTTGTRTVEIGGHLETSKPTVVPSGSLTLDVFNPKSLIVTTIDDANITVNVGSGTGAGDKAGYVEIGTLTNATVNINKVSTTKPLISNATSGNININGSATADLRNVGATVVSDSSGKLSVSNVSGSVTQRGDGGLEVSGTTTGTVTNDGDGDLALSGTVSGSGSVVNNGDGDVTGSATVSGGTVENHGEGNLSLGTVRSGSVENDGGGKATIEKASGGTLTGSNYEIEDLGDANVDGVEDMTLTEDAAKKYATFDTYFVYDEDTWGVVAATGDASDTGLDEDWDTFMEKNFQKPGVSSSSNKWNSGSYSLPWLYVVVTAVADDIAKIEATKVVVGSTEVGMKDGTGADKVQSSEALSSADEQEWFHWEMNVNDNDHDHTYYLTGGAKNAVYHITFEITTDEDQVITVTVDTDEAYPGPLTVGDLAEESED